jgi:hypothetical protein
MENLVGKYGWISIDEFASKNFEEYIHPDYILIAQTNHLMDYVFVCTSILGNYAEFVSTEIKILLKSEVFRPMPFEPKFKPLENIKLFNSKGQIEFGIIKGISWHNNEGKHIYSVEVNGKIKSRRYFEEDLERIL